MHRRLIVQLTVQIPISTKTLFKYDSILETKHYFFTNLFKKKLLIYGSVHKYLIKYRKQC